MVIFKEKTGYTFNIVPDPGRKIYSLFVRIMEVREGLKTNPKSNRIYYPYYIYKILELVLTDPEEKKLIKYIHLHKQHTLDNNDDEWALICEKMNNEQVRYIPTKFNPVYL